ncbi:MAG TPA: DUF1772 domain-containing protein [Blastocatellia bacterium]|jgi:hypothetical protein
MMLEKTIYFLSLLFAALALAPALAHLLELLNKMKLSRDDYLTAQQIYRGWALLGIVVFGALISTLVLTIAVRRQRRAFIFALLAFICIIATQIVFWTFTYPANQATDNWTVLPENWMELRRQWEYSHAASAGLNLLAFISLSLSVLTRTIKPSSAKVRLEPAGRIVGPDEKAKASALERSYDSRS